MSNTNRKQSKKLVCGIAVFILVAFVLQGVALLFMTPEGLETVYPYVLLAKSEKIEIGDAGLGEYFTLHKDTDESGLIILAVDTGVADSYRLASDYLKFLGKFTHISETVLYTSNANVRALSEAAVADDYEAFKNACATQRSMKSLSDQMIDFIEQVYSMNNRLSPNMKFSINGIKGYTDFNDIKNALTADLFSSKDGLYGEHVGIVDAVSAEEYVELFEMHREKLAENLGDKFEMYEASCIAVTEDSVEETFAFRNLVKYAPPGDGTVFAVLPRYLCAEDSVFLQKAEEAYGKITVTNTVYYDCTSLENGEETEHNDGSFPGMFSGIRIADANKLKGFRKYCETVTNTFDSEHLADRMNGIGEAGENTFFIISGSGPVTFYEENDAKTAGTVLIAPGA